MNVFQAILLHIFTVCFLSFFCCFFIWLFSVIELHVYFVEGWTLETSEKLSTHRMALSTHTCFQCVSPTPYLHDPPRSRAAVTDQTKPSHWTIMLHTCTALHVYRQSIRNRSWLNSRIVLQVMDVDSAGPRYSAAATSAVGGMTCARQAVLTVLMLSLSAWCFDVARIRWHRRGRGTPMDLAVVSGGATSGSPWMPVHVAVNRRRRCLGRHIGRERRNVVIT